MPRPHVRSAALLLVAVGAGYVWGHYGVTRDWFPYPQIADARRAAAGETVDERPAHEREPPAAYRDMAATFEQFGRPAQSVVVGDSMLARAPWRDLLPGRDVANRAIAGDHAAWLPARLDAVVATEAEEAFLMVGLNDAAAGRSADAIYRDIGAVIERLREAGMEVTVFTPLPCTASAAHCGEAAAVLAGLRELLLRDAQGAKVIDLFPLMAPEGFLLERYSTDGVHLNPAGLEVLIAQIGEPAG